MKTYQKPRIEVIRIQNEGVMAMSDVTGGGGIFDSPSTGIAGSGNIGTFNDIEDLINDLLTQ